jgi:hypothetical protein
MSVRKRQFSPDRTDYGRRFPPDGEECFGLSHAAAGADGVLCQAVDAADLNKV